MDAVRQYVPTSEEPSQAHALAARLDSLTGKRIGFVDNRPGTHKPGHAHSHHLDGLGHGGPATRVPARFPLTRNRLQPARSERTLAAERGNKQ